MFCFNKKFILKLFFSVNEDIFCFEKKVDAFSCKTLEIATF